MAPSHPEGVSFECPCTSGLWPATGKARTSMGPTALGLAMGTAAAPALRDVRTPLPEAEKSVVVGGEVIRWRLELYNPGIRATGS